MGFFNQQGFQLPARKGVADFLQEVTSLKVRKPLFWSRSGLFHTSVLYPVTDPTSHARSSTAAWWRLHVDEGKSGTASAVVTSSYGLAQQHAIGGQGLIRVLPFLGPLQQASRVGVYRIRSSTGPKASPGPTCPSLSLQRHLPRPSVGSKMRPCMMSPTTRLPRRPGWTLLPGRSVLTRAELLEFCLKGLAWEADALHHPGKLTVAVTND